MMRPSKWFSGVRILRKNIKSILGEHLMGYETVMGFETEMGYKTVMGFETGYRIRKSLAFWN